MSVIYYWIAAMGVFSLICIILFFISLKTDLQLIKKTGAAKLAIVINWFYLLIGGVNIGLLVMSFLQVKAQLEIINF